MRKLLFSTFTCVLLAGLSQPTWAQDIYRCVGSNGEVAFREAPCEARSYAESRRQKVRQQENQQALEAVKRRIMKVKREIMDLDRFYEFNVAGLNKEEAQAFKLIYDEDRRVLSGRLSTLQAEQTVLVETSFQFASMTGKY